MKGFRWTCTAALFFLSLTASATRVDGITVSHFEALERMTLLSSGSAVQKLSRANTVELHFDALGQSFAIDLEPNAGLMDASQRAGISDDIGIYRGTVNGRPDSWARIVIVDGVPRGLVWDGAELLAIEAPDDGVLETTETSIYRLADTVIEPNAMSCSAAQSPSENGLVVYQKMVAELAQVVQQKGPGAVDEITIGVIGDFEFTDDMGANANAAIVTRLNNVDGIFSQQLGVQITVPVIETFADAGGDPFTDTTVAGDLLDEVGAYRLANDPQRQQGLTHLYTGRNLDGSTAGIAYVGALCSSRFGAGLSEGRRGSNLDSLIAAHEIGHNFGANHDGDAGGSCPNEPSNFIMAPSVSSANNTFGPCSVGVMQASATAASCVNPLPSTDMAVEANGQPTTVALGGSVTITFDLNNNGSIDATNVVGTITLPGNVSFVAASASQGSCANNGATVTCSLGTVGGSSGATLTVSAAGNAVGTATFAASVAADDDGNVANNETTHDVSVEPSADVSVSVSSFPQVVLGQTTTLSASVRNASSNNATGVGISMTLANGVSADSATWSAGTCTVSPQQVDCSTGALTAGAQTSLTVALNGDAVGSHSVSLSVSANEVDPNALNNDAGGSVTVASASSGGGGAGSSSDDDEGGGSLDLFLLCCLTLLAIARRHEVLLLGMSRDRERR